uniref:glucocorticoid modulatory element-binding protein 2-like isoform X4 n=1 Tax=Myxine glutinosa TaxID=7769 RepID=UPI00358FC88D
MATGGEEDEIVVVTISDQPTADDTCVGTESAVVVDFKAADTRYNLWKEWLTKNEEYAEDHRRGQRIRGENLEIAGQSQDGMETVYSASTLLQKMDDSSEETDKGADDSSEDSNTIYPITCGDTKACLIWKKFVCPGINVKCVKFQSDMISPKEFVNMAGKSTLKDWKRAIRLRGVMLRKVMDSGELDFYQHEKVCTNTCRSTKFDILINNVRSSNLIGSQGEYMLSSTPTDVNGTQGGSGEEGNKECSELGSTPTGLLTPSTPSSECNKSRYTEDVPEDVFALWRGISEVGLLGEVVSEVQQEIQDTLKSLRQRIQQSPLQVNDVAILNNVVQQFGLMDNVKKIISNHKGQMDRYKDQYTRDLAGTAKTAEPISTNFWILNSNVTSSASVIGHAVHRCRPCLPRRQHPANGLACSVSLRLYCLSRLIHPWVQPSLQLLPSPLGRFQHWLPLMSAGHLACL